MVRQVTRSLVGGISNTSRSLFYYQTTQLTEDQTLAVVTDNLLNALDNSDIYQKIIYLNQLFVTGKLNELSKELTLTIYDELAVELYNMKNDKSPNYETTRALLANILENLRKSVLQYQDLIYTKSGLNAMTEKASILNSVQSILNYLAELKKKNILFTISIKSGTAQLKPEYAIYLSMYGLPSGGVFEAEKMAEIKAILSI